MPAIFLTRFLIPGHRCPRHFHAGAESGICTVPSRVRTGHTFKLALASVCFSCVRLFQDIACLQSKVLLVLGARCFKQANGIIGKRVQIPHGPATVTPTSGFAPFPQ